MATKKNTSAIDANMIEDPAKLVTDGDEPKTQQQLEMDERDREIAELRAQLAAEKKKNESILKGDDYAIVQEKAKEAAEKGLDAFNVMVSIRVPPRTHTNDKYYWVSVNGRSAQIPADNTVQEMRLPFAEAILNQIRADKHADSFADEKVQVYDPWTNPHSDDKDRVKK